jgi:ketosteroid isomerase-like protein
MSDSFLDAFARSHRQAQEPFNEGDFEKAFATLAPDVEWHLLPGLPETGVLRGRDAVIRFFAGTRDALNWKVQAQDFRLAGPGRVFVHQRGEAVGRTTKIAGANDFFQIWEIDDRGLAVRVVEFNDREDALEAAGLLE